MSNGLKHDCGQDYCKPESTNTTELSMIIKICHYLKNYGTFHLMSTFPVGNFNWNSPWSQISTRKSWKNPPTPASRSKMATQRINGKWKLQSIPSVSSFVFLWICCCKIRTKYCFVMCWNQVVSLTQWTLLEVSILIFWLVALECGQLECDVMLLEKKTLLSFEAFSRCFLFMIIHTLFRII